MKQNWKKNVAILTGVYMSRMFGMFLIFPVFSEYANQLENANKMLIGIALGIYGLAQGLLQLPFGYLSDKVGRKKMIIVGLILFLIGTLIAASAETITSMIIGRAIQGTGAISAVALALATDITPKSYRGKVMAIVGGSIGMSFVISLIIGPLIANIPGFGLQGIFWVIAIMVIIALITAFFLPEQKNILVSEENVDQKVLWKASTAIFLLHAVFTGAFVILPTVIANHGISSPQWWIYLPANFIAIALMRIKAIPHPLNFGMSFLILAISFAVFSLDMGKYNLFIGSVIFFIAFYRLETGLPHWIANFSNSETRGKAMGIYSTAQFIGSFVGAFLVGIIWEQTNASITFFALMVISIIATSILLYWGKKDTLSLSNYHRE